MVRPDAVHRCALSRIFSAFVRCLAHASSGSSAHLLVLAGLLSAVGFGDCRSPWRATLRGARLHFLGFCGLHARLGVCSRSFAGAPARSVCAADCWMLRDWLICRGAFGARAVCHCLDSSLLRFLSDACSRGFVGTPARTIYAAGRCRLWELSTHHGASECGTVA